MSRVVRKPAFCICKNKDADRLRGNREADQRLCFRYIDSTIHLLSKYEISWPYSPVCVGPGWKPRRPVFSQRGSYVNASVNSGLHILGGAGKNCNFPSNTYYKRSLRVVVVTRLVNQE